MSNNTTTNQVKHIEAWCPNRRDYVKVPVGEHLRSKITDQMVDDETCDS